MSGIRRMAIAGALALASLAPMAPAMAGPMPAPMKIETSSDVTQARVACGRWNCRNTWRAGPRVVIGGPRRWVAPRRVVIAPAARIVIRPGYNRHVGWCAARYRSYNASTNMFIAVGGVYRVCRSPY
jgi:hypothetical protein